MIPVPSGVRVWLAVGRTDMRKGMNGLALQVQEALGRDPHAGDLYVFRSARGDLIMIIWHDGRHVALCQAGWSAADLCLMAFVNSREQALPSACREAVARSCTLSAVVR